jgi:iron complex transport system substrate-binding protein
VDLALRLRCSLALALASVAVGAQAAVTAIDAQGERVTLERPAQRIVSLAPHATELVAAAGAEQALVGISQSCDFPSSVLALPRVSSFAGTNIESVLALKPDLVIAWPTGNKPQDIAQLRRLGINVFASSPKTLADIATEMEAIGTLAGTLREASKAANHFRERLVKLGYGAQQRPPLAVFYQLGSAHLYTLNNAHPVMEVIARCGGRNVFGQLQQAAPEMTLEAVLAAKPEAIVYAEPSAQREITAQWARWPALPAVREGRLIPADGQLLHRPSPRIIGAAEALCARLIASASATKERPAP